MLLTKEIKILLAKKEMNTSQLADKIGTSQQNLSAKMKRDNFSVNELKEIAKALNTTLEISFIDNNDKTTYAFKSEE